MKIIAIILILILIYVCMKPHIKEKFDTTSPLSNEALQNIASVYGNTTQTASFNNINITGSLQGRNIKSENAIFNNMSISRPFTTSVVNAETLNAGEIASETLASYTVTVNTNFNIPKKIRIFDMSGYNWRNTQGAQIIDKSNNSYKSEDWTCVVVGVALPKDRQTSTSGSYYARAYIGSDDKWFVNFFEGGNEYDNIRDRSVITIMAIPKMLMDTKFNTVSSVA